MINLRTYTIEKFINEPIEFIMTWDKKEALRVLHKVNSWARDRKEKALKALREEGKISPEMVSAYRTWTQPPKTNKGERQYIKETSYIDIEFEDNNNMSLSELRYRLRVAKNFLAAKTSTAEGAREYYKNLVERMGEKIGKDFKNMPSKEFLREFWDIYNKLKDKYNNDFREYSSTQIQQDIYQMVTIRDEEDIIDELQRKVEESYIKQQQEDNDEESSVQAKYFNRGRKK